MKELASLYVHGSLLHPPPLLLYDIVLKLLMWNQQLEVCEERAKEIIVYR
jgi:hypothetical protein